MKTAKLVLTLIMSTFLVIGLNAQTFTYHKVKYNGPEKRIQKKIKKGIRSGELTNREVKDLKREYRKIEKMKRKAWRNGHFNRREQRRIDHAMHDFERLLQRYLHNRKDRRDRYNPDRHRDNDGWNWYGNDYNEYEYYHKKGRRNRN